LYTLSLSSFPNPGGTAVGDEPGESWERTLKTTGKRERANTWENEPTFIMQLELSSREDGEVDEEH
jgi:hypothetical protein